MIFIYIAANFRISNRIARKRSNINFLEYKSNIRPILNVAVVRLFPLSSPVFTSYNSRIGI